MSPFLFLGILFVLGYALVTLQLFIAYFRSGEPLKIDVLAVLPMVAGTVYMMSLIHPRQSYRAVTEYA